MEVSALLMWLFYFGVILEMFTLPQVNFTVPQNIGVDCSHTLQVSLDFSLSGSVTKIVSTYLETALKC